MSKSSRPKVLIVGAGMAGLSAAIRLRALGYPSLIIDKGPSVGGRLATRRMKVDSKTAYLDHGAQFFTIRSPELQSWVDPFLQGGQIKKWFTNDDGSNPRFYVEKGMVTLSKLMQEQLGDAAEIIVGERVAKVTHQRDWEIECESEKKFSGKHLLLTPPVTQIVDLLRASSITCAQLPSLAEIEYEPCFALLATLKTQSKLAAPGFIRNVTFEIFTIADNKIKGISPEQDAVTIHASGAWSEANWNLSDEEIATQLWAIAAPYVGADAIEIQVKRWKLCEPKKIFSEKFMKLNCSDGGSIFCAGDIFGGPRVEGAFLSGRAAAEAISLE